MSSCMLYALCYFSLYHVVEGGKGEGQREFAGRAGWFGDLRALTVACQAIDQSRTTLNMLSLKSHPTSTHVYTLSRSHSAPTPHVYQTHTNPLYPDRLRWRNRLLHHLDQTSSLFRLSPGTTVPGPSTTVNDHRVSCIGTGGSTAEEFVFDPEIAGCIHAMWQDPAIPQMLDNSLVLVPDWWEYVYI
jgi:hypothetical protein